MELSLGTSIFDAKMGLNFDNQILIDVKFLLGYQILWWVATPFLQEILAARENSSTHIWSFRTVEDASNHWKELFGHLNDE